jgi:hypothetical protein
MGYGAIVTLHGAMGYGAMVLHNAKNYNKVMAPCDHSALAYGVMQYNYDALGLSIVQKGQIVKNLQIQFILCSSFRKGSILVTFTASSDLIAILVLTPLQQNTLGFRKTWRKNIQKHVRRA